ALAPRGIVEPTPIQAATLPDSLTGRDVLGRGRTGSGKTYAFLLPLVARLIAEPRRRVGRRPRSLVLAPTRELAAQLAESLAPLEEAAGLRSTVVFGGVGQNPQVKALAGGVDVLVACPGRLLDLMNQGHVDLGGVEITVIDEADHMADMGFLPMVRKILAKTPPKGQRMLFSATLDSGVNKLVKEFLHEPVTHSADPATSPVGTMEHHVLEVSSATRFDVLRDLAAAPGRTIMFTRTKYGAKNLARKLAARGVDAVDRHGDDDGVHRHRRPRHPRGRGGPGGPRRSARGAQGVPAPFGPHRPRRRVRHRHHRADARAEARRERPDAQGRHPARAPRVGHGLEPRARPARSRRARRDPRAAPARAARRPGAPGRPARRRSRPGPRGPSGRTGPQRRGPRRSRRRGSGRPGR